MQNDTIIVDFSEEIKAKTTTTCDACGKTLGSGWAYSKGNISISLPDGKDEMGYDKSKTVHTCDAKCLKSYLNKNIKDDE